MKRGSCAALALALCGLAATSQAATRYITDELRINLRTGAGNEYRILDVLASGAKLETLKASGDWTRVRTAEERTGWVRTQYLADEPAAADRLAEIREQQAGAGGRVAALEASLEEARTKLVAAQQRGEKLASKNQDLTVKLDEASKGLKLSEANKRLEKQVIDLKRSARDLQNERTQLAERNSQDWFLVGAAVMFVGIVCGILVTRIRWRRRSSWSEL